MRLVGIPRGIHALNAAEPAARCHWERAARHFLVATRQGMLCTLDGATGAMLSPGNEGERSAGWVVESLAKHPTAALNNGVWVDPPFRSIQQFDSWLGPMVFCRKPGVDQSG